MTYQLFPIGPSTTVHEDVEFTQVNFRAATLADGGFVVVWYDGQGSSIFDGGELKIRRYDSDGMPVGPEQVIYDGPKDTNWNPFVVGLTGGGYAVAWQPDPQSENPHAHIAIFDAEDNLINTVTAPVPGPEGGMNLRSAGVTNEWSLVALETGGFAMTWAAHATFSHHGGFHIREAWFTQIFEADGTAIGQPHQISDWSSQSGFKVTGAAALGEGYILFKTLPASMTDRDHASAAVQLYSADGIPVGDIILLDPDSAGMQYPRDIVTLADGTVLAQWYTSATAADGGGLKFTQLGSDGTPIGESVRVEGGGTGGAWITPMPDGGWLISWHVPVSQGRPRELHGQRYDADGNPVGEVFRIADVRFADGIEKFGFSGFSGPSMLLALEDGPLVGIFNGHVSADGRSDSDVFVKPFGAEILGSGQSDLLKAGDTPTALFGLEGNDTLIGGAGNDTLIGGPGNDHLDGGGGQNLALFSGKASDYTIGEDPVTGALMVTDLRPGPGNDGTNTLVNIHTLSFADEDVAIATSPAPDTPITLAPMPELVVVRGHTLITGTAQEFDGNVIYGWSDAVTIRIQGVTFTLSDVTVSKGSAILDIDTTGDGTADTNVTLQGNFAHSDFVVTQSSGGTEITTVSIGQWMPGTSGNDTLIGGMGDDTIWAYAGDDLIHATAGNNLIGAGPGNDTVQGGAGNDTIWAGAGDDLIYGFGGNNLIGGGLGDDTIYGASGNDTIWAGAGDDLVYSGGGNNIIGVGAGNDTLIINGNGDNLVYGGQANPDGSLGSNTITIAGTGNNTVFNGIGDDKVILAAGSTGDNLLWGGKGDDLFDLTDATTKATLAFVAGNGHDTIENFSLGAAHYVDFSNMSDVFGSVADVQAAISATADGGAVITVSASQSVTIDIAAADLIAANPADWLIL